MRIEAVGMRWARRQYLRAMALVFVGMYLANVLLLYELVSTSLFSEDSGAEFGVQDRTVHHGTTNNNNNNLANWTAAHAQRIEEMHASAPIRIGVFLPLLGLKRGTSPHSTEEHEQDRRRIEGLAIQGWRLTLDALRERTVEAHVYGLVESSTHCDPTWQEIGGPHFACKVLPMRCLHPGYDSTPTMDCVFAVMRKISRHKRHDYDVFANGDLLFSPRPFAASIQATAKWKGEDVVLVGQRTDTTWHNFWSDELTVGSGMHLAMDVYVSLHERSRAKGSRAVLHPDFGIDYFVMASSVIPTDFPPFLVGRFRWDNALLARFLTDTRKVAVVDATAVLRVLHVGNMYSSKAAYHRDRIGAGYNDALAKEHFGDSYNWGRTRNAPWVLDEPPGSATEAPRYVVRSRPLSTRPDHTALLGVARAGEGPLLLIPVLPHEVMHGLRWVQETQRMGQRASWFQDHYLFATLDQETHDALEAAAPGCVLLEDTIEWPRPPAALSWRTFERLVKFRLFTVAILTASELVNLSASQLEAYAEKAAGCSAVFVRKTGELLSVQPQTGAGLGLWRRYKAGRGMAGVNLENEDVCWLG